MIGKFRAANPVFVGICYKHLGNKRVEVSPFNTTLLTVSRLCLLQQALSAHTRFIIQLESLHVLTKFRKVVGEAVESNNCAYVCFMDVHSHSFRF